MSQRSQLVSDFFDHMTVQGVPWVVMNNYDGVTSGPTARLPQGASSQATFPTIR